MKKFVLVFCCFASMLLYAAGVCAQVGYNERAQKYVETYCKMAMEEQRRSGVPAAITLGQGILETEAGLSELMTQANNHFGIKCKSDWGGDKFLHTDDAPNECFKKYSCAAESYKDHSDYLHRNQRYAKLFSLKPTDYKSWAVCLRQCGYATNPQYAQILIKIIENFNLQNYTLSAFDSSLLNNSTAPVMADEQDEDPSPIQKIADSAKNFMAHQVTAPATQPATDTTKVVTVNDMKAFYAHKGESLKPYAAKYKVSYNRLLEMNDFPDAPLLFSCYVYLEKKQTLGDRPTHVVKEGETLLMISQIEGVQLRKLLAMNMLNPNEEPATGATIYLQSATAIKPDVRVGATIAHNTNAIITDADTVKQDNDYIATKRIAVVTPPPVKQPEPAAAIPVAAPPVTAATVSIPTAVADTKPVVDTTPVHVPSKHVIIVKTEEDAPKQVPAASPVVAEHNPVPKQDTTSEEEFSKLKAELDQVVYADDSKIIAKHDTRTPQVKAIEIPAAGNTGGKYYTVKRGDTAFSIAKRNNITVDELYEWNDIDANGVKVGKSLRIK